MAFHGDTAARRRAQLATAHMIAARLSMDSDTYRDMLQRLTGKRSMAKMDFRERRAVLDELRRLSGDTARHKSQAVPPPGEPKGVREENEAMLGKVAAILADLGCEWNYAHGIARKMFGIQRVEWLSSDQLHKLVSALTFHQRRKRRQA